MDSNYPNYYGNNQHSQTNPNAKKNPNAQMPIDPNLLNHHQLAQLMALYSTPQQNPSVSFNAPNIFPSQFNPSRFPPPNMFPPQTFQFPSTHIECPSSQPYNKSPRTPVGDVGSSRILFQDIEDDVDEDDLTIPSDQPGKSKSKTDRRAWTIAEDRALCSAYLEAGGDSTTGTDQRKRDLWASIMELFAEAQRENPSTINVRNYDSCDNRWKRINSQVNKWVGIYAEAQRKKKSGWNEENVLGEARQIWEKSNNGRKFLLEHCWDLLKCYPKWQGGTTAEDQESGHSSKRSNSDSPTVEIRPVGVKRAKQKGKQTTSSNVGVDDITNCINYLQTNREMDNEQIQIQKQMLDFFKEKEEKRQAEKDRKQAEKDRKQAEKERDKRFTLYSVLMGKSVLSPREIDIYEKLYEEFKDI